MHRRLRPAFAAAVGALAFAAPLAIGTGATAAPPPVEVAVQGIEGTDLVATARCETPQADIDVIVRISQEAVPYAVEGSGRTGTTFDCGSTPVALRVPLSGSGVLVAGEVGYEIEAVIGGRYIELGAGSFTAANTVALPDYRPQPDDDTLPIRLDEVAGESATGPVVLGTITCEEPRTVTLNAQGWQTAGRHNFNFWGFQQVTCAGATSFAVPLRTWWTGGLGPGPATVTVHTAQLDPDAPNGRKTATVTLTSSTPEPDFRPEPVPGTSISFGDVVRADGNLTAVVRTAPCEPGHEVSIAVSVRPVSVHVDGRWFYPERLAREVYAWKACNEREQTHLVTVPEAWPGDEVAVEVDRVVYDAENPEISEETHNAATITVSTK